MSTLARNESSSTQSERSRRSGLALCADTREYAAKDREVPFHRHVHQLRHLRRSRSPVEFRLAPIGPLPHSIHASPPTITISRGSRKQTRAHRGRNSVPHQPRDRQPQTVLAASTAPSRHAPQGLRLERQVSRATRKSAQKSRHITANPLHHALVHRIHR